MRQPDLFESNARLSVACLCGRTAADLKLWPLSEMVFRTLDVACPECGFRLKITGMLPEIVRAQ